MRIALASYDIQALRVNTTYFVEYGGFSVCRGYQEGSALLHDLEDGAEFDLILLDDVLKDMDAVDFTTAFYRLQRLHKPILLLMSSRSQMQNQGSVLQPSEKYCIIKPYRLQSLTQQIQMLCGMQRKSLQSYCEQLYLEWGVQGLENNCAYLTQAVGIALASARKLAIRKEILLRVGETNELSITAVDSAIRRILEHLNTQNTQAWCSFKREYEKRGKRMSTGGLIYAIRDAAQQFDIHDD